MTPTSMMEDCFVACEDLQSAMFFSRLRGSSDRNRLETDQTELELPIRGRGGRLVGVQRMHVHNTFGLAFTIVGSRLPCLVPPSDIRSLRMES